MNPESYLCSNTPSHGCKVRGETEKVSHKHKNSYNLKSSLLKTNGTYSLKEPTVPSVSTLRPSCCKAGQQFFIQGQTLTCCSKHPPTPCPPQLSSSLLLTFHFAAAAASSAPEVLQNMFNTTDGGLSTDNTSVSHILQLALMPTQFSSPFQLLNRSVKKTQLRLNHMHNK